MDPNNPNTEAPNSEIVGQTPAIDLLGMNRAELVDHATTIHGLSFKNGDTKADIIAAIKAANGEGSGAKKKYVTIRQVAAGKLDGQKRPIIHPVGDEIDLTDDEAAPLLAEQTIKRATKVTEL